MTDPIAVIEGMQRVSAKLDTLSKELHEANLRLDSAEQKWDEVFDKVAESLKDEMQEAGRKGDPAEHVVTSAARREHRSVYQEWRRAKRELDKLERIAQNRRAQLSAFQSELGLLRDEARADVPQPQWSSAHQRQRSAA